MFYNSKRAIRIVGIYISPRDFEEGNQPKKSGLAAWRSVHLFFTTSARATPQTPAISLTVYGILQEPQYSREVEI
jgi:hypothetical protein